MKHALKHAYLSLLFTASCLEAATFSFIYNDPANFGYKDSTPVAPVGGNMGTTLGQQRKILIEHAADIWGNYLQSDLPIVIDANFVELGGTSTSATLAFAGPTRFYRNFTNAPQRNIYYAVALANSLRGSDLDTANEDLIVTVNSSIDSDPNVLGGAGFYYGLDGNPPSGQVELLNTLLHEIGHGLGFISTVNVKYGTYNLDLPDSFTALFYDEQTDKAWIDMSNTERRDSAKNAPNLVFRGAATQQAMKRQLKPANGGVVVSQIDQAGNVLASFNAQTANMGYGLPPWGISGALVLVDDGVGITSDAAQTPLINAEEIRGRIALIDRGSCDFDEKAKRAQDAGAIAVIVANNAGDNLVTMFGNDVEVTIPSLFVGQTAGSILKTLSPDALIQLSLTDNLSGTCEGSVCIHAPNPIKPGSSLSHWSTGTFPNLLMEPTIAATRLPELDLTVVALRDIGWSVKNVNLPFYSYALWAEEMIAEGSTDASEDADGDGASNFREYVFGTDPMLASNQPPNPTVTPYPIDKQCGVDYTRNRLAADVIYSLQLTNDLSAPRTTAVNGIDYLLYNEVRLNGSQVQTQLNVCSSADAAFFSIQVDTYEP